MKATALLLFLAMLGHGGRQEIAVMPGRPGWTVAPTAEGTDYPALALLLGIETTVRLRCRASADGRVSDCEPVDAPGDLGFERSAMAIIERGRVQPHLENGAPVDSTFSVSVPFAVTGEADIQRYEGAEPSERTLAMVADRMLYGQSGDVGLWWSFSLDGLSAREQSIARSVLREAFADYRRAWWGGLVLSMARLSSEEMEIAIDQVRDVGPIPPGDADDPVYDQLNLVEIGIRDRARMVYCADHACPPQD